MNDWVKGQVESIRRLEGRTVVRWLGTEMAIRESGPDGLPVWEDESVPMLQMIRIDLALKGGERARIETCQNDDGWGLSRGDVKPPEWFSPDWFAPERFVSHEATCIYRTRKLDELPVGEILAVRVELDDEGRDISEVRLSIAGHDVRMRAGEIYDNGDETLTVRPMDESILVQVDGRRPGPPSSPPTPSRLADG